MRGAWLAPAGRLQAPPRPPRTHLLRAGCNLAAVGEETSRFLNWLAELVLLPEQAPVAYDSAHALLRPDHLDARLCPRVRRPQVLLQKVAASSQLLGKKATDESEMHKRLGLILLHLHRVAQALQTLRKIDASLLESEERSAHRRANEQRRRAR